MKKVRLGKSGLVVSRSSFGCIPIQRIHSDEAVRLLHKAYDTGINYYDTARGYTDSEIKLGLAFSKMRSQVLIATKTQAKNAKGLFEDLEISLRNLQTDYIDVYQVHNPSFVPVPGGEDGLYEALLKVKEKGMIRHIGLTNHAQNIAMEAAASGLYETIQYPFSCLSLKRDEEVVNVCKKKDVGFIAMKGMAGGLIQNVKANFSYITTFDNVVPIWGNAAGKANLKNLLPWKKSCPPMMKKCSIRLSGERELLNGDFCRGCGYCMPCPAGIYISIAARMDKLLTRSLAKSFTTPYWRGEMEKIKDCIMCMACAEKCPYHLKPYEVLQRQIKNYEEHLRTHEI